ncbi:MAG: hypothetical protein AB7O45_12400 [Alphaproteobacteria bacterium]
MRTIASTIAAATLLALATSPAAAQGPAVTLSAPCAPVDYALALLKTEGFAPVARGLDAEGDPFAIYRRGDGAWRAIAFVEAPSGGRLACAILGGDRMSVGDVGEPA